MSRVRIIDNKQKLSPSQIGTIYKIVEEAIAETDFSGKSTDKVFGEIFTRFRTSVISGAHEDLRRVFCTRLKALNGTKVGEELNEIINEIYQEKVLNEEVFLDLELCTTVMDDCLQKAKQTNKQSEEVISNLKQIGEQLNGENNV